MIDVGILQIQSDLSRLSVPIPMCQIAREGYQETGLVVSCAPRGINLVGHGEIQEAEAEGPLA